MPDISKSMASPLIISKLLISLAMYYHSPMKMLKARIQDTEVHLGILVWPLTGIVDRVKAGDGQSHPVREVTNLQK